MAAWSWTLISQIKLTWFNQLASICWFQSSESLGGFLAAHMLIFVHLCRVLSNFEMLWWRNTAAFRGGNDVYQQQFLEVSLRPNPTAEEWHSPSLIAPPCITGSNLGFWMPLLLFYFQMQPYRTKNCGWGEHVHRQQDQEHWKHNHEARGQKKGLCLMQSECDPLE